MPRKKSARRFEPRGGVSQSMIESEARYVPRELDDYLLLSITELRERLAEQQVKIAAYEEHLQKHLTALADHERLALRCMLSRDVIHLAALYLAFFQSPQAPQTTAPVETRPEELTKEDELRPALAFAQSLFEI